MRKPDESHECPLMKRVIRWGGPGGCYEIQEVRDDNMDVDLLPEPVDMEKAEEICERCLWYRVNNQ